MYKIILWIICFANLIILITAEPSENELEAINFLNKTQLNYTASIEELRLFVLKSRYIQNFPINSIKNQFLATSFPDRNELNSFRWREFENADIKRQLEILNRKDLFSLDYNAIFLLGILRSYYHEFRICYWKSNGDCYQIPLPILVNLSYQTNDANEMLHFWKMGKNLTESLIKIEKVLQVAKLFRKALKKNEYEDVEDMWYVDYEQKNFSVWLEALILQLKPFYMQLHAYIRDWLRRKYPNAWIHEYGTIPQHLLNEVLFRVENRNIEMNFMPFSKHNLSCYDEHIKSSNRPFQDCINTAEEYLMSMGFDSFTQEYFNNHIQYRRVNKDPYKPCFQEYFDFDSDIALKFCVKPNLKSFIRLHGDLTWMQYSKLKARLPIGLNREPCPGFAKGLAKAVALSALNSEYLHGRGFPTRNCSYRGEIELNMQLYLSIELLFPLMEHFVQEKLWIRILSGDIEPTEYNCHYWSLLKDYAGIEPPQYRSNVNFDVSQSFFDVLEERPIAKIMTKLLGFHIHHVLCASKESSRNGTNLPVRCSFHHDMEIGKKLRQIMSMGSKKPWFKILEAISETKTTVDGSAILEYFQPLRNWLTNENEKNQNLIGWNSPLKCDNLSEFFDEDLFKTLNEV